MKEKILKLETERRCMVNGENDTEYEFNVLPFDSENTDATDKFCDGYAGVYILARANDNDIKEIELLHCGISGDIKQALHELSVQKSFGKANCLLYYYEPLELVRNDVYNDIITNNKFEI